MKGLVLSVWGLGYKRCMYVCKYACKYRVSDRARECLSIAGRPQWVYSHVDVTVGRSPAWHRRLRKKRSQARARISSHRLQGLEPRCKDIFLLESHHSPPVTKCPLPTDCAWGNGKATATKGNGRSKVMPTTTMAIQNEAGMFGRGRGLPLAHPKRDRIPRTSAATT